MKIEKIFYKRNVSNFPKIDYKIDITFKPSVDNICDRWVTTLRVFLCIEKVQEGHNRCVRSRYM